jgi:hypothetical protein
VGLDAAVPLQVARSLGIDKSLSWKVCRIVTEPDPAQVAARLPGRQGLKIVGKALRRAGASGEAVAAIEVAADRFRAVAARHAGDRDTLAAMLAGSGASETSGEAQRKQSFIGNSATWGVKAKLQLSSQYLAPSATDRMTDAGTVSGFVGFQRLRNDLPWSVANVGLRDDQGNQLSTERFAPVDPGGMTAGGVPLLSDYCTQPLPAMTMARLRTGAVRLLLGDTPVGKGGAVTILAGWMMRGVLPRYRGSEDESGTHTTALSTPVEVLVHDLFIHRSLQFAMNPQVKIYSQLPSGPLFPADGPDAAAIRIACAVENLGSPADVTIPEYPAYPSLVDLVTSRLGWKAADFVGFRLRLKYPPIPAMSVLRHDLAREDE